jgi:hypothetical protein
MELDFQIYQKDTVEQVLTAVGMQRDQELMHESISYIDGFIYLSRGDECVHTIMLSKVLGRYCYYE